MRSFGANMIFSLHTRQNPRSLCVYLNSNALADGHGFTTVEPHPTNQICIQTQTDSSEVWKDMHNFNQRVSTCLLKLANKKIIEPPKTSLCTIS